MTFALVAGGGAAETFLARLPHLTRDLGPVAAQSYRLASRISNALKAGRPARHWEELADSRLVLVCMPEPQLAAAVAALAEFDGRGRVVLLCGEGSGGGMTSALLHSLRAAGAATGSLNPLDGAPGWFVAEGDRAAVRHARRLAHQLRGRVVAVPADQLQLLSAGLSFGTALLTPLLEAAARCFRQAGVDDGESTRLAEALCVQTLRGFRYSRRRSWTGAAARGDFASVAAEIQALAAVQPLLSRYYRDATVFALDLFARHPELRDALKGVARTA